MEFAPKQPEMLPAPWGLAALERVERAMSNVQARLIAATRALHDAGVPYAVVGGNAVAAWVGRVDQESVRHTKDVDILVRRSDFESAKRALEASGFSHHHLMGTNVFIESPKVRPSNGVHILFANERVWADDAVPHPDVTESVASGDYVVLTLEALVRVKLTANRDHDRTHLRDLIRVGLIDASWLDRFPPVLAERLRYVLDTPNG